MENIAGSEEQQSQSEASDDKPGLSQIRKSWGFRRSTLARREFMEEVGDLSHSPPPLRRVRGRCPTRTTMACKDNKGVQSPQESRTVIEDLEWSASCSPVSEETKPAVASAGGCLDPSMWQDIGSAFHTAFTLLGGDEDLSMEMSRALAVTDNLGVGNATEAAPPQAADDTEVSELRGPTDSVGISHPVASDQVAQVDVDNVLLISSQEEDSDDMPLIQTKEQLDSKARQGSRAGRGGRGKARGRWRGRGKGKGRGRGRGRAKTVEVASVAVDDDDDDDDDDVILVNPPDTLSVMTLSPVQQTRSDFIIVDTDVDQNSDTTSGQCDDAPEEEEEGKQGDSVIKNVTEYSSLSDSKGYDPNALYCICRQKHNKRFMISCNSCQEYFHGDCVGISEAEGCKEYICPPCTTKQMSQLPSECHSQAEPEISPESLSLSPSGEEPEGKEEWESLKKTVDLEANDIEEVPAIRTEPGPEPEGEIETDCSGSLCIGPGCSKPALQDSVYCGTDCIVQHAAVTMKSLSDTKVPNPRGQVQRKATPIIPTAKGQCSSRVSARLAAKAEECAKEEELMETDGTQTEATSSIACDPTLTGVQATPQPSPKFYTASSTECKQIESETHQKQNSEDPSMDACPPPQLVSEPVAPQSNSHVSIKKSTKSDTSVETTEKSNPSAPPVRKKSVPSLASQSPTTLGSEHNETGAVLNSLTSYIIPKKQSGLQSSSSHMIASCQKPSVPTLLNEPRNLPVPPAPSAPPSRPSQPNNQVRQSIQRSLTSILSKRVCDCEELNMSESDAAKLVASIEMEMFNIFRNTDSKYMNKYRTIMFNLKDPRNKGLLYRVVQGDISPFRLVRMSQKDMQATKAPDHNVKDTSEVENPAAKASRLLQKPEAVKIDLSCLNVTKPEAVKVALSCLNNPKPDKRPVGNKRSLSTPTITLKNRVSEPRKGSSVPDVLTCMLKDTTSEHKAHLFDLKCKICTGQMGEEEPPNKKNRVSESSDKHYSRWRKSTGDDSPLRVPPDSPDFDYSSSAFDSSCPLIIDTSDFALVESPASPIMDSPASPTLESPASPVMESPTSPVSDTSKTTRPKRTYTPVVIPAISTVTITRRDPRTAANRSSASSRSTSGPITTLKNQSAPYAPPTEGACTSPSIPQLTVPPTKLLPKPILMKPSSSADPRLYGTSSRNVISESPASGETSQFLAKQEVVWKGFLNMFTVSKFATKAYLVSGSAEILRSELADSVEIGGRIMPQTVWDYVAKLKTNITKELCVIRFHPATEEEEVAYISLFSYFSSRGRFGVVSNNSRSIKDIYLVPLSAKESIPSILQPLEGPGLEKNRPNLLLGLAIIQKAKRSGSVLQEIDEKKSKVVSKDPMWIPKPPVLYGSGKLEVFQPYDPETPTNTTPPVSPPCPGSPSEFSSNTETLPSHVTSTNANPTVSTSAPAASTQSTSSHISDRKTKAPTPLSTILSTLFRKKQTTVIVSNEEHCTTNVTTVSAKVSVLSHVSGSMVDPIVQQYGQKSKVKDIEEEYTFDRPYDPEEEYDPATGYGTVSSQSKGNNNSKDSPLSKAADDDVAYDPEDETIFQDVHCNATKPNQPKMSNCPSSTFPISTQVETQSFAKTPTQTSSLTAVPQNLPTGSVVVSAATLTEQQRMLEELNKQIEEQKRQLKEQEEALRQQREAVGMFMAHFSVTDSMMSPPSKSLPLSQVSSLQSGIIHSESKPSESKDSKPEEASNLTEVVNAPSRESQTDSQENTNAIPYLNITSVIQQDEVSHNINENEKSSSAGEIEDSDVPYDPEDELFNEIQDDVFQVGTTKTQDSSLPRTYAAPISYHRRRRSSPKKRSHRERDRCRSPSRRSHQCSVSHSRKHRERDRHRKSERDRSKHRTRDHSEREARHRKSHSTRRHSHDHRSPSSTRKNDLVPSEEFRASPNVIEKQVHVPLKCQLNPDVVQFEQSNTLHTSLSMENTSNESSDKVFSQENLPNLRLETSQQTKSNEPVVNKDSVLNNSGNVFPPQMNTQLGKSGDKFESSVPLREIDPPIRDSPESPDPDPQFIEPSVVAQSDKIIDCQTQISNLTPAVEVDNELQLSVNHTTLPLHFEDKSNVGNLIFRALDIQGSDSGEQNMTQKEREQKCFSQTLSEILGQGGGPLNQAMKISTSVGPEMGHVPVGSESEEHTEVPNLKGDENMSQSEQPASKPCVMDIGVLQIQGMTSDLTENDLNRRNYDQESILKSNVSTCSDEKHANKKYIKREEASMHRPEPTIKYRHFEANTSYRGQDTVGSAHHFKELQYDIKLERSVQSLDMKVSENLHEHRKHNVREVCSLGPGQVVACMGGQRFSDAVDLHVPDRDIEERLPDSNYVNIQGRNKYDQCPERTNEKSDQQDQCSFSNIMNTDWKTGIEVKRSENMELFDCKTNLDWRCPGSVGDSVRIGQHGQNEGKVHQPGWRGTTIESHGPVKSVTGGIDPCKSWIEMGGPDVGPSKHDSRLPGCPDVTGPRLKKMYPDIEVPVRDWREPDDPDFIGPMANARGPDMDTWTGPQRLCTDMRIPMHDRRGPDVCDFRTLERKNPAMVDGFLGRKPVNPDFREPRPEKKHSAMNSLGYGVRGPSVPDHLGSCFEGVLGREGTVHDNRGQRGPGGHDVRGKGPDERKPAMECLRIDTKGRVGSHFSGPGNERRELSIDRPWDTQSETGNPNMKVTLHDWRGPDIMGPGPERDHIGPDNRRHQPFMENRIVEARFPNRPGDQHLGPITECPGPDRRHPNRQEIMYNSVFSDRRGTDHPFRGPGPDKILPQMISPECNWRCPHLRADLEPERKGPASQDLRGPECAIRNPNIEGLGPDRREPGDRDFRNTSFQRSTEGTGPNWREYSPPFMGPGNRQNSRSGPDNREDQSHGRKCDLHGEVFRGTEVSFESADIEGRQRDDNGRNLKVSMPMRGNDRGTEPGINSHQAKWKTTDCRYPAPDHRSTDAEEHWSDGREIQFKNEWNRQDNRYPRPIAEGIDVPVFEYNTGDPCNAQRGPGMRERGLVPERTPLPFSGPRRIPADDRSGPGCREPRRFQDNTDIVRARPGRLGPGNDRRETSRGRAEPRWGSENIGCRQQDHERRVQEARQSRSMERARPVPEINNSFQNRREFEMQDNHERRGVRDTDVRFHENSYIERPVSDVRNLHSGAIEPEREGLDIKGPTPGGQGSESGFRMEGPDMRRFIHNRMDMRGAPDNLRLGHGPSGWDTDTECNRRVGDKMGPRLDSNEPDPATKDGMKCSDIRDLRRHNRQELDTRGRRPRQKVQAVHGPQRGHRGSSENPQSQQVKIPKPRAALLPTPTEGRICLPNHKISNSSMFSINQKQMGHHINRQWSRGRSFSQERQRQEAEKGPAGKGGDEKCNKSHK